MNILEALLLKFNPTNEKYELNHVVLKSRGRDAVLEMIEGDNLVESYPLDPGYQVWVEEEPASTENTFDLSIGEGMPVTIWKNALITKGDGDTNPASLSASDIRLLKINIKIKNNYL